MKELIIEITNRCNNNCIHCSSKNCGVSNKVFDISLEEIKPFVLQAIQSGYEDIVLSGGEPFLHPNFCDLAEYFINSDLKLKIYTSGVFDKALYKSSRFINLLDQVDTLVVSCYSHEERIHNYITNNSYSYRSLNDFLDFVSPFHNIELNNVPMSYNYSQLSDTYDKYKSIFKRFNLLRLVRQGNAELNWSKILVDNISLRDQLTTLSTKENTKIGNSFGLFSNSKHMCEAGCSKMCLTFDGFVIPCEVFKKTRRRFRHCTHYLNDDSMFLNDTVAYSKHNYSRGCQAHSILPRGE